jgi:hypothetical protein
VAGVLILFLCLAACSGPASGQYPFIMITQPANGAVITTPGDIIATVKVSNFRLVDKLGQTNVAGEGHIAYFMDVDVPTDPGKPAVTAPGTNAQSAATSYTWHNVAAGNHTFAAELVNNDDSPLNPPVIAEMMVIVGNIPAADEPEK